MKFVIKLLAVSLLALLGSPVQAQEVKLRLHHFLPPQEGVAANVIVPLAERIQNESNGRIEVQVFPAMQMGGTPPQLFDQVKDGVVDMAWVALGYTPGRFRRSEVFELPFVSRKAEPTSRAFWRYVQDHAQDEFKDVHLLATFVHGPGLLHANTKMETPEDLNGLTLRGQSSVTNDYLGAMGAEAVGMPLPATPEALSKGVLDGIAAPWSIVPTMRLEELVRHHTEFADDGSLFTLTFALVMNRNSYESLPDDLKAVFDNNDGLELSALFGAQMDAGDRIGRERTAATGKNEIVTVSGSMVEPFKTAADAINDSWMEGIADGAMLFDAATSLVAEEVAAQN